MYILIDNAAMEFKHKHSDVLKLLEIAHKEENETDYSIFDISDQTYFRDYTCQQLQDLYYNTTGKEAPVKTKTALKERVLQLAINKEITK